MTYSWLISNIVLGIPFTTFPDLFKNEADETPDTTACIFIDYDNERSVLTFVEFLQQGNGVCKNTSSDGSKERWHHLSMTDMANCVMNIKLITVELGLIAYKFFSIDHRSDVKHEVLSYRLVPGVEIKINDDDKYI